MGSRPEVRGRVAVCGNVAMRNDEFHRSGARNDHLQHDAPVTGPMPGDAIPTVWAVVASLGRIDAGQRHRRNEGALPRDAQG